jgi:hypothetical protein
MKHKLIPCDRCKTDPTVQRVKVMDVDAGSARGRVRYVVQCCSCGGYILLGGNNKDVAAFWNLLNGGDGTLFD